MLAVARVSPATVRKVGMKGAIRTKKPKEASAESQEASWEGGDQQDLKENMCPVTGLHTNSEGGRERKWELASKQ